MSKRGNNPTESSENGRRSKRRRWRRRSIGGLGGEMARRSSDIYPINRFELSNRGSGDRSDTYIDDAHASVNECTNNRYAFVQKTRKLGYVMSNVDLLCLITETDIDGSVCRGKKRIGKDRKG